MIYYNSNTINDWNFGDDNIIKVYRNNAVCYYKVTSGDTPTPVQEPCFAVVDDISQYSDTEFEDVYNKADGKWYKLNNLNQYEEYGVYGSGRTITTYEGKLTVDDGYEYIYSGGSWVNLGEVSGSTITIKSPEYIEKTSSFNGYCSLLEYLTEDTKIIVKHRQTGAGGGSFIGDYFNNDNDDWRVFFASRTLYYDFITQRKYTSKTMPMPSPEEWEIGNYYIKNTATSTNLITGTHQSFSSRPNEMYLYYLGNFGNVSDYGQVYYIKIYRGETLVRDFIPWTDMNGNYGLYDKVEGELVHTVGNMTASTVINDVEVGGGYEYPLEYVVREDPPNNLTFSSMEEAEAYECPWVGMNATIDGDKYVFSGDSQSGYEWVYNPSRLPIGYTEVEYIENTSTAYINTNFKPNQDTRILLTAQCVTSTSYGRYIGAGDYNAVNAIQFDYESGVQGTLHISWGHLNSWTVYSNCVGDYGEHTYDWDKNYFYRDKGKQNQFSATTTYTAFQCIANLGIFCHIYNNGGVPTSQNEFFKGKLYTFKMYDNGTLIRDLVPAKRDSDSKYGMYDIVNDAFYLSPNNVNFSGGAPVI